MIYFDNSAVTYPKPRECNLCVDNIFRKYAFNIGRGGYRESMRAAEKVFEVRELAAKLFNTKSSCIVFTKNCTEALNYAIKGIAKKGDHFIISSLEHNSVTRCVKKLCDDGVISFDIANFSYVKNEAIDNFRSHIKSNTKAIICTVSSNVFGVLNPIEEIGRLCREKNINFIVDASQGAGLFNIDMKKCNIDFLCTSGQKYLYGPMGTGILAVNSSKRLNTVIEGGTGSKSLSLSQPEIMPDRFESGTLNVPGIILLGKGIEYIKKVSINSIYNSELNLIRYLYEMLCEIKGVKLYTPYPEFNAFSPILSFNVNGFSSEKTAALLAENNICTRGGYHCSPLAHKTFKTYDSGTVRVSLGCFNSKKDCEKLINVVKKF